MSFWRRLFTKDRDPAARRLSLKEQYQRKVQLYAEILTASNTALEFMAQIRRPACTNHNISVPPTSS